MLLLLLTLLQGKCSSPDLPQCGSPSESRPSAGKVSCSSMGFSTGSKQTFSPVVTSEHCKSSAGSLIAGQRETSLECVQSVYGHGVTIRLSLFLSLSYILPKQKAVGKPVSTLKHVYSQRRWLTEPWLVWRDNHEVSYRGYASSPITRFWNQPKRKPNIHHHSSDCVMEHVLCVSLSPQKDT